MPGTHYSFIESTLRQHYTGGIALEVGAGAALYRSLFDQQVATDLPESSYIERDSIDVFCDARALPFADHSFDFAFSISTLHLIPQPDNALKEIVRVLKKGSNFFMFDIPLEQKKRNTVKKRARGDDSFMALWTREDLYKTDLESGFSHVYLCNLPLYAKVLSLFRPNFEPPSVGWLAYRMAV